jgi:hypothetical protein
MSQKPYEPPAIRYTVSLHPMNANLPIGKEEYLAIQNSIANISSLVMTLDLERFLEAIAAAEATGPTLDPTLYIKAIDRLTHIKKAAGILVKLKELIQHDMQCVCGHGFKYHMTPNMTCIVLTNPHTPDIELRYCACDQYRLDKSEY